MANILVLQLLWRLHFWSVIKSVLSITNKIKSKPFGFYSLYYHYIQKFPYSINFYVVFFYYPDLELDNVMSTMKHRKQFVCQLLVCK